MGEQRELLQADRILVVEDDEDQRLLLQNYIAGLGYDVRGTADADEAHDAVKQWSPGLILLDVHLPGVPGIKFLQDIKEELPEVPVLLMSADNSEELAIVGLSSGASDFMTKPIRMAELTVKIQNNLELVEYRAALRNLNKKLEREKSLLTKYFSADIVQQILAEEVKPELGGTSMTASILFMDIRSSTGIAESIQPGQFAEFISSVFTEVMAIVFEEKGSVNKLMGDGILATFGCPIPHETDARNSLVCARKILEFRDRFNESLPAYLPGPLELGVGIATGRVFAGNVGSPNRMEYTVLGDAVNSAARLQDLTKRVATDVLMDRPTWEAAALEEGTVKIGNVRVRGRNEPLPVYGLGTTVSA